VLFLAATISLSAQGTTRIRLRPLFSNRSGILLLTPEPKLVQLRLQAPSRSEKVPLGYTFGHGQAQYLSECEYNQFLSHESSALVALSMGAERFDVLGWSCDRLPTAANHWKTETGKFE
jgi:hypothetical protein